MLIKKMIISNELKNHFEQLGYQCNHPHNIVNNNDTVFISAGIQPLLADYRKGLIKPNNKIYISQPVLRTQFVDTVSEGFSIAFINLTTASFNNTEQQHNELVGDWLDLFYELGLEKNKISTMQRAYERQWGDLLVKGKTTFYYYDNVELGDTTFFNNITRNGEHLDLDTMSDVGFGLERIRWVSTKKPFFDLYSNSESLNPDVKALLSALALLAVNNVKPSNKNSGYRARLFSKKLVNVMSGVNLSETEIQYLNECLRYWADWQEKADTTDINLIMNEYVRNCNRFILDRLIEKGYDNISNIDINLPQAEFKKRLKNAKVNLSDVEQFKL